MYLLRDNAPSHISRIAKAKVEELEFIEFDHPSYSPDLVPSDYDLFPKLKNYTRGRQYKSDEDVKKVLWDGSDIDHSHSSLKAYMTLHIGGISVLHSNELM